MIDSTRTNSSKISPFVDKKGEIMNNIPAEILQNQYSEMWSKPSEDFKIRDATQFFEHPEYEARPKLCDIKVTKENLIKMITKSVINLVFV